MTPEQALNKLRRLRDWNKMTDVKREALDVAIEAVESHEIGKKVIEETEISSKDDFFFPEGIEIIRFRCSCCKHNLGMYLVKDTPQAPIAFPKYCSSCGQKLKASEE